MKRKLTVIFASMAFLVIFCSFSAEQYNGFKVEKDFIVFPISEEMNEYLGTKDGTMRMPLVIYTAIERVLKRALDDLNAFKPVSDGKLELYKDIRRAYESEIERQTTKSKVYMEKVAAEMTEVEMDFVAGFELFVDEYAYEIYLILDEVTNNPYYYDSYKELFDYNVEDIKEYDLFMKLWFPNFTYLTTYEATECGKENPNGTIK